MASKASTARYHRVVNAKADLVSDQRVQAITLLGRLVEHSGFDESQDRAEISHVLGVSGGQFSVAISARLLSLSFPRLDALSELLKFTATDSLGGVRSDFVPSRRAEEGLAPPAWADIVDE